MGTVVLTLDDELSVFGQRSYDAGPLLVVLHLAPNRSIMLSLERGILCLGLIRILFLPIIVTAILKRFCCSSSLRLLIPATDKLLTGLVLTSNSGYCHKYLLLSR